MLNQRRMLSSIFKFWRSNKPKGGQTSATGSEVTVSEEPLTMQERLAERGIVPREREFPEGIVRYSLTWEVKQHLPLEEEHAKVQRSFIFTIVIGVILFIWVRLDIKKNRRFEMASREYQRRKRKAVLES